MNNKRKALSVLIITLFVFSIFVLVYILRFKTAFKQKASDNIPIIDSNLVTENADQLGKDIENITNSIILPNRSAVGMNIAKPETILAKKTLDSKSRKAKMLALLEKDVDKFLRYAVPQKVVTNYDIDIKNNFEKDTALSGQFENVYYDNFEKKEFKNELYLKTDGRRLKLYTSDKELMFVPSGQTLNVTGFEIDNKLAVSSYVLPNMQKQQIDKLVASIEPGENINDNLIGSPVSASQSSSAVVNKRVAVILYNFLDNNSKPWTLGKARKVMFSDPASVANYYKEVSFGRLNITGDVYDWITVPVNSKGNNCSFTNEATQQAISVLTEKGVNFDSYDYVMSAFPKTDDCNWSGLALLKGGYSWINGSFFGPIDNTVVVHELGHNLGAHHANELWCISNEGVRVSIDSWSNCKSIEYADEYDPMGNLWARHFSNFHKGQLGFFLPYNTAQLNKSGTYNLFPVEKSLSNRRQSFRIPAGVDRNGFTPLFYYLEYRRPFGLYDNFLIDDRVVNGVSIRLATSYTDPYIRQSELIDTTPASNLSGQALGLNKTFLDKNRGIKIKVIELKDNYAKIEYTKLPPPCIRNKPSVGLTPVSQWATPGSRLSYTLSIQNNDTVSCGPSIFTINPTLFNKWYQSPENLKVVLEPQASVNREVSVGSDVSSSAGYFTFTESILHSAGSAYNTSIAANYNIYYSDHFPPTITFIRPTEGEVVSGQFQVNLSIVDNETEISNVEVLFDDGMNICSIWYSCWVDFDNYSNGSHTIKVLAYDAAKNRAEAQISIVVENPTPSPVIITPTPNPTNTPTPSLTPKPKPTNTPTPTP